jgi:hypothetical protein
MMFENWLAIKQECFIDYLGEMKQHQRIQKFIPKKKKKKFGKKRKEKNFNIL